MKKDANSNWVLNFRRVPNKPGIYHIRIDGQQTSVKNNSKKHLPILNVKLIVTDN